MPQTATLEEQEEETSEGQGGAEEQGAVGKSRVHPLDPDFLVFAMPLALLLDVLSYIFMGLDAGIIAAIANIVLGGLLVLWMVKRGMRLDQAKEMYQQAVQTARKGRAGFQGRREAAQQMATKRMGGKASKRFLKRALIMYVGESIPILNFIPFWLLGVVLMLREK